LGRGEKEYADRKNAATLQAHTLGGHVKSPSTDLRAILSNGLWMDKL